LAQGNVVVSGKRTLEIDEDMDFQRREWSFQRVGVALLAALVLGALLGITGMGGPLSHSIVGEPGGPVQIEYERFVRRGGVATLKVHLSGMSGEPRLWISDRYFDRVRIESVEPQPHLVLAEARRHVYAIRIASPQATITLEVRHQTFGRLDAEIGVIDGPSFRFSQFSLF
jgi:hypothetical protein